MRVVLLAAACGPVAMAWAAPASAQLMLPGAGPPSQQGSVQAPAARAKPAQASAAAKLPGEDAVVGKTLFLNGTRGRLVVERHDKTALTARFIAVGDKISRPAEACGLDLGGGTALDLKAAGRPDGMIRWQLDFAACPVVMDVLDGAVLISGVPGACTFVEADCKVDPRGVWGQAPSQLESMAKAIEADRTRADRSVRSNFKILLKKTTGKQEIKAVAAEQAGFTSERETLCRDYAGEGNFGFCATRYTELRAASLLARLNRLDGKPETALAEAAKPKPKPKAK